jgi:hypothetical protein
MKKRNICFHDGGDAENTEVAKPVEENQENMDNNDSPSRGHNYL